MSQLAFDEALATQTETLYRTATSSDAAAWSSRP